MGQFRLPVPHEVANGTGIMLGGGSVVNSTTEELVLQLLNENEAAGIKLSDKRHPTKQLERRCRRSRCALVGSVVANVTLLAAGTNDGPEVRIRFKICEGGMTDWVGWMAGAISIGCAEHGGLGFIWLLNIRILAIGSCLLDRAVPIGCSCLASPTPPYAPTLGLILTPPPKALRVLSWWPGRGFFCSPKNHLPPGSFLEVQWVFYVCSFLY